MRPWCGGDSGLSKVLICAGGTGGGIYPALAAAHELQALGLSRERLLWIGTQGEMEEELVPRAGIRLERIRGGPLVGVPLRVKLMNGLKLAASIGTAYRLLRRFRPDVMLMTGGYMAVPVALAARLRRVPIVIYLPDVEPGSTIKAMMPLAQKVATTTAGSAAYVPSSKMVVTGYPVRAELRRALTLSQEEALAQFDLTAARPTLFVFGGSRGAWRINQALMAILPQLLARYQVIHISGTLTWPQIEANLVNLSQAERDYYRPYPYLHERMGAALRAADLVVARAGASMLGEAPAFGLPCVLVPLTFAWRYQKVNADFLTAAGTAVQLTDETINDKLLATVSGLLDDAPRRQQMAAAARRLDQPEAARQLAQLILNVGQGVTA
jgi:UDP-N-acetylglucosamine--N-acetylmuramyl-(pentapeptide) pyrophosphoryl-undecaprenol N-acetylglucosamine transferase